ncbi:bis-aminopropyl spermidine synthase family protein [Actinomadura sp. BRA 177]|uniref:bis-aminopropyl spermidine synthase family protein n=1 Tax=Actinomadura sp. BRA 177 TaxID=2745202 RepID=UPI001595BDD7|nr:bis-aminopropyl spermidine synthase family protein [Actinomadura sp. BRA 177]NVI90649.1 bis-aminopropyl spermidine synthase family protein [Actinomadura sp. BRA 177]
MTSTGQQAVHELRADFGIDAGRIDQIGRLLAGGAFRSIEDVVSLTGTSRRTVEAVFRALEPHLESSGDGKRIAKRHIDEYSFGAREPFGVRDPWTESARRDPDVLAAMAELIDAAPPPVQALDHVPATAETVVKRARFMLDGFDLTGAHVLFVGDHDLTSLGLFLAGGAPGLRASVVDVDERLLEFVDAEAARRGWDVRCHFADLRLGLPAALRESCELVFTDPPYTPEGVQLFVARGLQGLRDHRNGRVLLAYGYGERQAALGLAVQKALNPLHLAYEAMLPGFNRYVGAQAVGSAAALYVLRPTRRTAAAARAVADDPQAAMYTHGAQSVEASGGLDGDAAARIIELGTDSGEKTLLVGDDWPADAPGRRIGLPAFLGAPLPRNLQDHGTVLVNLYPGFGASAIRALLAANAPRTGLVCRNGLPFLKDAEGQREFARLIGPKYRIVRWLRGTPGPGQALVLAERTRPDEQDGAGRVLGYMYARAHGKLGNGWREGLIALQKAAGRALTKGEARAVIGSAASRPELLERPLMDLPPHLFAVLEKDVERSVAALPG